jgi:hypothetical protein
MVNMVIFVNETENKIIDEFKMYKDFKVEKNYKVYHLARNFPLLNSEVINLYSVLK